MYSIRQGYAGVMSDVARSVEGHATRVLKAITLVLCSAAVLSFIPACTGDRSLRDYYGRCIDRMISQYEHNPDLLYFSGGNTATCNVQAVEKIQFYADNRDTLIALMEDQDIGRDPDKVDRFLHKAYVDSLRTVTASASR